MRREAKRFKTTTQKKNHLNIQRLDEVQDQPLILLLQQILSILVMPMIPTQAYC
jgi:hypothetical protein